MKDLIKAGFNKGILVGVAIVTASAVMTVASVPKVLLGCAVRKANQEQTKTLLIEKEE